MDETQSQKATTSAQDAPPAPSRSGATPENPATPHPPDAVSVAINATTPDALKVVETRRRNGGDSVVVDARFKNLRDHAALAFRFAPDERSSRGGGSEDDVADVFIFLKNASVTTIPPHTITTHGWVFRQPFPSNAGGA